MAGAGLAGGDAARAVLDRGCWSASERGDMPERPVAGTGLAAVRAGRDMAGRLLEPPRPGLLEKLRAGLDCTAGLLGACTRGAAAAGAGAEGLRDGAERASGALGGELRPAWLRDRMPSNKPRDD